MHKRITVLIALVLLITMLGVGYTIASSKSPIKASNSSIVRDGMNDQEYAQYMSDWKKQVRSLYSSKPGNKKAGGLPDSANKIVKTELLSYGDLFESDPKFKESFDDEVIPFLSGKYELRVTFDNGRVSAVGPFKAMPSIVDIRTIKLLGKSKKVLIIEE